VREFLERHLDVEVEPTRTIRSVYGQWFPFLAAADPDWAAAHVSAIFRIDGERELGRVAWRSYLQHNRLYNDVVELLHPLYVDAVARAGIDDDEEERQQLIGHLIALYVLGFAELDDDLLGVFFTEAPVDVRAQLINAIGFDLADAEADAIGGER